LFATVFTKITTLPRNFTDYSNEKCKNLLHGWSSIRGSLGILSEIQSLKSIKIRRTFG